VILKSHPRRTWSPVRRRRDFGISYDKVDRILYYLIRGMKPAEVLRAASR